MSNVQRRSYYIRELRRLGWEQPLNKFSVTALELILDNERRARGLLPALREDKPDLRGAPRWTMRAALDRLDAIVWSPNTDDDISLNELIRAAEDVLLAAGRIKPKPGSTDE